MERKRTYLYVSYLPNDYSSIHFSFWCFDLSKRDKPDDDLHTHKLLRSHSCKQNTHCIGKMPGFDSVVRNISSSLEDSPSRNQFLAMWLKLFSNQKSELFPKSDVLALFQSYG